MFIVKMSLLVASISAFTVCCIDAIHVIQSTGTVPSRSPCDAASACLVTINECILPGLC